MKMHVIAVSFHDERQDFCAAFLLIYIWTLTEFSDSLGGNGNGKSCNSAIFLHQRWIKRWCILNQVACIDEL